MKRAWGLAFDFCAVVMIQLATNAILLIFIRGVLLIRDDYQTLIAMMMYVSPDSFNLNLFTELVQLTLFIPTILFISIYFVRQIDAEHYYLIVRHGCNRQWYAKTILKIILLSLFAAFTAVFSMLFYVKFLINHAFKIAFGSYAVLSLSVTLGILFFTSITWLISINKPLIVLMLTLVILMGGGKTLTHMVPNLLNLTVISALSLNHMFSQSSDLLTISPELGKVIQLVSGDLLLILLAWIFVYQRLKIMSFVRRNS